MSDEALQQLPKGVLGALPLETPKVRLDEAVGAPVHCRGTGLDGL